MKRRTPVLASVVRCASDQLGDGEADSDGDALGDSLGDSIGDSLGDAEGDSAGLTAGNETGGMLMLGLAPGEHAATAMATPASAIRRFIEHLRSGKRQI